MKSNDVKFENIGGVYGDLKNASKTNRIIDQ
jgi:hypothetical protein